MHYNHKHHKSYTWVLYNFSVPQPHKQLIHFPTTKVASEEEPNLDTTEAHLCICVAGKYLRDSVRVWPYCQFSWSWIFAGCEWDCQRTKWLHLPWEKLPGLMHFAITQCNYSHSLIPNFTEGHQSLSWWWWVQSSAAPCEVACTIGARSARFSVSLWQYQWAYCISNQDCLYSVVTTMFINVCSWQSVLTVNKTFMITCTFWTCQHEHKWSWTGDRFD